MPGLSPLGFIGLGNMGTPLASNLVACGFEVVCFDVAGPSRCVEGATFLSSVAEVSLCAPIIVLSLPDGRVSQSVAEEIASIDGRATTYVVDTSTIGVSASRVISTLLQQAGVGYVDAPVSGGAAGARARTLAVMFAGTNDACAAVEGVLAGLSDKRFRVGAEPGMAQAVKLANNYLSATALAATSEAIAFGMSVGVDMATMLTVLNASSGQNTATSDKFPNHVLTGRYASGFTSSLMAKDVRLFLDSVATSDGLHSIAEATVSVWEQFVESEPGVDFTRIYPFVSGT